MNTLSASDAPLTPAGRTGRKSGLPDLVFDAAYSAAVGGSVLALFFLSVDLVHGRPLYTPSLLGTVLFSDVAAHEVTEVRMDMVAYFTVVHFLAFATFGTLVSLLCRWTGLSGRPTALVAGVVFVLLSGTSLVAGLVLDAGVLSAIGIPWILAGHALTAYAMAAFLRWSHRPDEEPEPQAR